MGKKEIVFKTPWFEIESEEFDDVPALGGKPMYRMNVPPSVMAIVFTLEGKLILVRQFRPAQGKYTVEVPTGYMDKNETPERAVEREFREETGYRCDEWQLVSKNPLGVDRINGEISIFLGRQASSDPSFQREDGMEVLIASWDEVKTLALKGELGSLWVLGALALVKWKFSPPELQNF